MSNSMSLDLKKTPWWKAPKASVPEWISAVVENLYQNDMVRREAYLEYYRRYTAKDSIVNLSSMEVGKEYCIDTRIRHNVVRSVIDTLVSQQFVDMPRVQYMTDEGDFSAKERAKGLTRFTDGVSYQVKTYQKFREEIGLNALIFGTGLAYPHIKNGKVKVESAHPKDVFVVNAEMENPTGVTQLYWVRKFDREELIGEYPEKKAKLLDSGLIGQHAHELDIGDQMSDMVTVVYAWHFCKSNPELCISTDNCVLERLKWKTKHPFVKFTLFSNPLSYFGIGVPEYAGPAQDEIQYLIQKFQANMTANSGRVWLEKGSKIDEIDNSPGAVNEYVGKDPIFEVHNSIAQGDFQYLMWLINEVKNDFGISQLQSQGEVPKGFESGSAIRSLNQVASRRHRHITSAVEWYFVDLAEKIIEHCAAAGSDLSVVCPDVGFAKKVKFSDVAMDRKEFVMKPWPANLLSESPAGKMEDLMRLGQTSPVWQQYMPRMMFGIPDVDSVAQVLAAPQLLAEQMVDMILNKGVLEAPFPEMDIMYARQYGQRMLNLAVLNDVDDEKVLMLRSWVGQVAKIISDAQQGQAMAQNQAMQVQNAAPVPQTAQELPQEVPNPEGVL